MKAYRIRDLGNGLQGVLECHVNPYNDTLERVIIVLKRNDLCVNLLYCPEVDSVVDEREYRKICKEIYELINVKENGHTRIRHLFDMSKDERLRYHDLEHQRSHYYDNVSFMSSEELKKYVNSL